MNVQWRRQSEADAPDSSFQTTPDGVRRLSEARRGDRGVVLSVSPESLTSASTAEREELERRLLEIGFVEGARIEILHEGFIGRDPIAVRLDDMRVALRRREAQGVLVRLDPKSPGL
jgi:ferrous iron transport protein A